MKNTLKSLFAVLLVLACIFMLAACSTPKETPDDDGQGITTSADAGAIQATGLWENAIYLEDMEFGNGEKTVVVQVKAEEQVVNLTIKTDKDTVGAALLEYDLIAGEDSQYGLYVKVVNGITADYDVDQSYWSFYINDEYAMTGVDSTEITEGATYQLVYTK